MYFFKDLSKKRLLLSNPFHLLATGFGSGLCPFAPGTVGSMTAILLWYLIIPLPQYIHYLLISFGIFIGIYLCYHASKDIGVHDHSSIVWDEFIGMWITLIVIPKMSIWWTLIGFLIFRLLDIWKPWPICWLDRNLNGGIGMMLDDIIAGIISAVLLSWIRIYCPL